MSDRAGTRRGFITVAGGALAATVALGRAHAQARTLRFVATGAFAPFNLVTDDGRIGGIYADILAEIGRRIGFQLDYRPAPWARAQRMVAEGQADGFVTIPTAERRAYAVFTERPLVSADSPLLVTVRGAPVAERVKAARSLDDLAEFAIGDYRANSFGESIHKDWPNRQIVNDIPSVLRILDAGRIDYTLQIKEVAQFFAKKQNLTDRFEYTPLPFLEAQTQHFHIAVRTSLPDASRLIADIEREQERLRGDGTIAKVIDHYA